MGRKLDEILDSLPRARRSLIERRAAKISKEMAAASLQELRRAADKTQAQIAESMGLAQNAISQLERRQDVLLSTLDRYVEAVGGSVMVIVQLRNGERFRLKRGPSPVARKPAPSQRSSKLKSRT